MKFTSRFRVLSVLVISFCLSIQAIAQLPRANPHAVSLSSLSLSQMDGVISESIARRELPGAVVLVSRNGRIAWRKAYGNKVIDPVAEPMI
jgi:hypothetical protein